MTKPARALMVQGTGSDVGKSLIVAGLCRALVRRGHVVRPFKPQNMSNNAAVTADGGEIGRAQALQARACGVAPSVHMNPVLLKPETDSGAQVVVRGRSRGRMAAREFFARRGELMADLLDSFRQLSAEADFVLVEGAGSAAEVNLRRDDIANMGFAEAADLPVVLAADIHRGGVIASLVGTHAVLGEAERARVVAYLVNKFRGDPRLFDDGVRIITERTGWLCAGIIPHFAEAHRLPAEDAMALDAPASAGTKERPIRIVVPRLSRIANFDDLDPLRLEPDVSVEIVPPGRPLPMGADAVLLPGTKSTLGDLAMLREQGWDIDIAAHVRQGGAVLGICGGYQLLGRELQDPDGLDGPAGTVSGLGLLDIVTRMEPRKTLRQASGRDLGSGAPVSGYEIHMGRTTGPDCSRPFLDIGGRPDGACSRDGLVRGCYLHGLFAADAFRAAWLGALRDGRSGGASYEALVEQTLDALAEHLEKSVDIATLIDLARAA